MTAPHDGVLLVRDDGVIVVLDAVPVDADVQRQIDQLCALLGTGRRDERQERTEEER